jgi:hypothetical protein
MRSFTLALAFLFAITQVTLAQDPSMFDAGLDNQMGLVFSPDGESAFWVAWNGRWGSESAGKRTIYMSQRKDGAWSAPLTMPFSATYSDDDPFVSPDGRWLYFVSNRPASDNDKSSDGDIWRYCLADRRGLERLSINSEMEEYSPVVTASGTLYFASTREGGYGQGDLYMATQKGRDFNAPTILGSAINSATGEWNLWVSTDETEMIFEASSRATNVSASGDLYYSYRSAQGWEPAIPLERLNTSGSDLMPRMHPNNETLFFTTAPLGGTARIRIVERSDLSSHFRQPR